MNKTTEAFESENSNYSSTEVERALKLAEEALYAELESDTCEEFQDAAEKCHEALAAIREALAEHDKPNRDGMTYYANIDCKAKDAYSPDCICWTKAEPVKQEPVYAFRRRGLDDFCTCTKERYEELVDKPNLFEVTTFYAAPVSAKREWVDLTDDEILMCVKSQSIIETVRRAFVAFKEKQK